MAVEPGPSSQIFPPVELRPASLHSIRIRLGGLPAFDNDPDFGWNIGAGLFRPDDRLRLRVDAVIEALLADGTIAQIYARYGIVAVPR